MKRPSKDRYYMNIAHETASRSTCNRLQPLLGVGAILVGNDSTIGTGYSGAPRGMHQCNDKVCPKCMARFNSETGQRRYVIPIINPQDLGVEYDLTTGVCPVCKENVEFEEGHKLVKVYDAQGNLKSVNCLLTVHAEANAIMSAGREKSFGATLYCTHLPCWNCTLLIINAGITKVVYEVPYKPGENLELLKRYVPFVVELAPEK
jgi:dCMP deaminase